ncbi:mitochondrial oxaloacetate transport protein [Gigaspora margarita]|uniref:Mitochondrial oxaloacetate transport protein n=1 Tax=Gigaspora margarita TaxID=4874 RepID=A0A8H3WU25_GIGMA|nr:mitochondrial oxaloacetate transport protein [Gigaspora margarita]
MESSNVSTVSTEISQTNDSPIKKTATKDTIGPLPGILIGGAAACAAVTFSNPWEVVKTRLQLQGELARNNSNYVKPYKNVLQAVYYIIRHEGLFSINKGLAPAYVYQIVMNGSRLGLYDPIRNSLVSTFGTSNTSLPISIVSGGLSGIIGAFLGSPFNLVKTRMQAFSTHMAIGHQHAYKNTFSALNQIWKSNGLKGLFTGVNAAMLRTGVGSATQLSSYFYIKRWIIQKTGMNDNDILLHCLASLISGLCVCTTMNPFDVISTRMFNQKKDINGKGSLYNNTFDCFIKTIKIEGIRGFYKGYVAHYFRIGPHTILTLVFLEQFRGLYIKYTR